MNQEISEKYIIEGDRLKRIKRFDDAIAAYNQAIELNPDNYIYLLKLGDILFDKGLLDEALSSYRNAMKLNPRSPKVYRTVGSVLQKQGLLNEAISEFYKFLQLKPNDLEPYEILGKALEEARLFEEAADLYLNGIKANQKHIKLHLSLGKVLEQQNKFTDAIKHYKKVGNTEASCLLGKCIAKQGLNKDYEEKWQSLNQPTTDQIKKLNTDEANETDSIAVEEYFRQTSSYRVISIDSIGQSDLEFLSINGFSLDKFDLLRQENIDHTEVSSNSVDCSLNNNKLLSEDFSWCSERHQITILKAGYIYSRCPSSGRIIKSNQSLYIFYGLVKPVYCYRFVGDEVFYLIIGGTGGSKLFAYIPRIELIVILRNVNIPPYEVINKLKAYCVTFFRQVSFYITDDSPKEIAVIVGDLKNIGHHIWNELSAIQNLCDTGTINKISQVFIGIHEFLNIEDVFPELSGKVIRCSTELDFFRLVIENNYISVRVTGKLIQNQLAERIYKTSVLKCDSDFLEQVERLKQQHFPLLWIQVRNFRVKWLSQVDGLASLIRKLYDDFPNLGVVFDGWSLPERQEHSGIVVSKIRKEKACMENIVNLLPQEIGVYSTIGDPIYKTIVWAYAVSLYVVPMGSGLALIRWVANKEGVIYGNRHYYHLHDIQIQSPDSHRESCSPLSRVPISCIYEEQPGNPESDYDFEWKILYDEAKKIIMRSLNNVK